MNDTPEIADCLMDYATCPVHGANFITMPRNEGEPTTYEVKCPWRKCFQGRLEGQ